MKQQTSRFKVEKYTLFKVRHDLVNIKDTKSIHLQRTIDQEKHKKNVLKFLRS